jgi:predicted lipoprotein with Yx(FWY)xxD motif
MSSRSRIGAVLATALTAAAVASLALVLSLAGTAAASPSAAPARAKPAKIKLRSTDRGKILVSNNGFTLYAFGKDSKRKDKCVNVSGCTGVWPITTTHGKPQAGRGVRKSLLGTIRVRGKTQVTYGGHPLYGYSGDVSPGSTDYVGVSQFGGVWRAVKASGKTVG